MTQTTRDKLDTIVIGTLFALIWVFAAALIITAQ